MIRDSFRFFFLISAVMVCTSGCFTEAGMDKGKFSDLNRAAQDMKAAIGAGKGCEEAEGLVQRLASGTTALQNKTASKAERDLLSAYSHLLAISRDGLLLCQSRTLLAGFPFVPKGRIYVAQELDPIVEKYDLPTEMHLYAPTGKYWRSIPEDSISTVWESAAAEIQHIENMVKYSE
jgi:hypothetical protein